MRLLNSAFPDPSDRLIISATGSSKVVGLTKFPIELKKTNHEQQKKKKPKNLHPVPHAQPRMYLSGKIPKMTPTLLNMLQY